MIHNIKKAHNTLNTDILLSPTHKVPKVHLTTPPPSPLLTSTPHKTCQSLLLHHTSDAAHVFFCESEHHWLLHFPPPSAPEAALLAVCRVTVEMLICREGTDANDEGGGEIHIIFPSLST